MDKLLKELALKQDSIQAYIAVMEEQRRALVDLRHAAAEAAKTDSTAAGQKEAVIPIPVAKSTMLSSSSIHIGTEPVDGSRRRNGDFKTATPCELTQPELIFEYHRVADQDCPSCLWPVRKHRKDPELAVKLSGAATGMSLRARTPARSHGDSSRSRDKAVGAMSAATSSSKKKIGRPRKLSVGSLAEMVQDDLKSNAPEEEEKQRELWEIYQRHKHALKAKKPRGKKSTSRATAPVIPDPDSDSEDSDTESSSHSGEDDSDSDSDSDSDVRITGTGQTKGASKATNVHQNYYIPKAQEITAALASVPVWDESMTYTTSAKRFLAMLTSGFRRAASNKDPLWSTRMWPAQYLSPKLKSPYVQEWVERALVDKGASWDATCEKFLERYRKPGEELILEMQWTELAQKKLPLHDFKDKFLHMVAQRGYSVDTASPAEDKLYADEFTRKIDPALRKAWVVHPTYGPLADGFVKTLESVMRGVGLVHDMLLVTTDKGKGVAASGGGDGVDVSRRRFFCKNHGANFSHNTPDCVIGKGERKVSFRDPDTAVAKGILKSPMPAASSGQQQKITDMWKANGNSPTPPTSKHASGSSALGSIAGNGAKCSHCGRPGHTMDRCFALHPELRPSKANSVNVRQSLAGIPSVPPPGPLASHPTLLLLQEGLGVGEAEQEIENEKYPFDSIPAPSPLPDIGISALRVTAPAILDRIASQSRVPRILIGLPDFSKNDTVTLQDRLVQAPSILKEAFSDSGCNRSALDSKVAKALCLPIVPMDGVISLANTAHTVPRIGCTAEVNIALYFVSPPGTARIDPISFMWGFEVMENIQRDDEYSLLFGQDLMDHCWHLLESRGVPAEAFLPFTIGKTLKSSRSSPSTNFGSVPVVATASVLPPSSSAHVSIEESKSDLPLDLSRDLEPVERFVLERDSEDSEEWTQKTQELLNNPVVQSAIQRNASIPKTSFCSDPEAILRLDLKPGIDPASLFVRQYPMAQMKMEYVDKQIQQWAEEERIEPAPLGCVVNNPLLCVPKMEGGRAVPGKYRVCIDPRRINAALATDDKFPIAHIGRNHQFLAGKELFGEIDIENCFLQFRLAPECRHLTAFTWKGKQWQFVGAPFGIKYFPNWIHRFISSRIAGPLDFTCTFVDNAAFGANSWGEHKSQLVQLMNVCSDLNLRVKTESIKVGFTRIRVLGHIVSKDGLFLDPRKLSIIRDWPRPTTGKEIQSFLGTVGFVRQYIRHYADLSAPLEAVKNVKGAINWTPLLDRHFEQLKIAVANPPFLRFPDFSRPFYLGTDASQLGVGGVLYQPKDGDQDIRPDNIVAIVSKVLSGPQLNYSAFKRELLALVFCLRQFHQYIWGRTDTVVYTDHKPLTYMFTVSNPSVTLQAYLDVILEHCLEVRYRPGVANVLPDFLSRVYGRRYDIERAPWGVPANIRFNILPEELDKGEESLETKTTSKPTPKPRSSVQPVLRRTHVHHNDRVTHVAVHASDVEEVPVPADHLELSSREKVELLRRGKSAPAVPDRVRMIQEEHAFGHFGRDQIFRRLWDKGFWWPEMRKQIQVEIMKCDACSRFVVHREGFKPAEFITADGPWHHIQIDCQTHLPRSPEGYTTLLSFVDVFSGFCLLYPLSSHTAHAVAQKLWSAVSLFGFPQIVQSDNGTEFTGKVIKELMTLSQIDHRFIAAYNPRADGKVERTFGMVNDIAKKLLQGANNLWPLFVEAVQSHINSHISSLTKSTPFALMFGRDPQLPTSFPRLPQDVPYQGRSVEEWMEYQMKIVEVIRPSISKLILDSKLQSTEKLDAKRRLLPRNAFPVGSSVMIKDPVFLSKHSRIGKRDAPYIGPYIVVRRDRNGNFILKDMDEVQLDRHVPPDQMKPLSSDSAAAVDDIQTVELVINHRGEPGQFEYLVKWKKLPVEESSWVPAHDFLDTQCIRDYWTRVDSMSSKDE